MIYDSDCHIGGQRIFDDQCNNEVMNGYSPTEGAATERPTEGLRERRRRETQRELSDAAIELFEKHGVTGTTGYHGARKLRSNPGSARRDAVLPRWWC